MYIIIFILILAILIIVHEYGHFIVAKKWGVRVDEFGLGYPPRAKILFKRKGTVFTLNWIPFGGFVKIFGENPEDVSKDVVEENVAPGVALTTKSKFAQISVIFAGPLFNFLFAWLVILVTLFIGLPSSIDSKNQEFVTDSNIIVTEIIEDSPAEVADIRVGDVIQSVTLSGVIYNSLQEVDFSKYDATDTNIPLTLSLIRGEEQIEKEIQVGEYRVNEKPGIGVGLQEVGIYKPPFFMAIGESFRIVGGMIYQTAYGLADLVIDAFKGQADVSNLTGPVGIVALVGDASTLGFVYLLTFVALISINLGIINLIPFPALDGGRILFLVIEKMKGSPISAKVSNVLNAVGFIILIVLMIFITFRDVMGLF